MRPSIALKRNLCSQHSLVYKPKSEDATKFRKIQLKTKQGGLTVYSRKGYYPAPQ